MVSTVAMRLDRSSLTSNTLLHTGFSLGEGLWVFALVGIMAGLAISQASKISLHLAVVEPVTLSSTLKIEWMVHWAETGAYPTARDGHSATSPELTTGLKNAQDDFVWKRIANVRFAEMNGAFAFTLDDANRGLDPQLISFRPAFAGDEAPTAVSWVCGYASTPPGFVLRSDDATTIKNSDLPSPCRSPMTNE